MTNVNMAAIVQYHKITHFQWAQFQYFRVGFFLVPFNLASTHFYCVGVYLILNVNATCPICRNFLGPLLTFSLFTQSISTHHTIWINFRHVSLRTCEWTPPALFVASLSTRSLAPRGGRLQKTKFTFTFLYFFYFQQPGAKKTARQAASDLYIKIDININIFYTFSCFSFSAT